MSDITEFKDMNPKRYPLHHDHGTVTISRDVFESITADLERLRPMECGLELAEADKVISELKESVKSLILDNYLKDKEIRRHKHKRCLAMAELCCERKENCYNIALRKYTKSEADFLVKKSESWEKWEDTWTQLAYRFNGAK